MSIIDVKNMMCDALDKIKETVISEDVAGKPIMATADVIVIPVNKLTVAFLTAGAEIDNGSKKPMPESDTPIGGIGGGITLTPQGFLIINKGIGTMIKTDGDNGGEKWMDLLTATVKNLFRKD